MGMMIESLREDFRVLDTSHERLRSFGLTIGLLLILVASVLVWRAGWVVGGGARWLAGFGATLVFLGLAAPALLRPLYRGWMGFALVLGHVMTRVLLSVVFFLVVTPIGLIRRALGRDPIQRAPARGISSYWIERDDVEASTEHLERYW
ncbi:MAG TPA: SxtJ family membrane protein [Gemmatimonadota bacterium]|nr:SxtJ family membrane protein [Gemmatimonadota bacterium]